MGYTPWAAGMDLTVSRLSGMTPIFNAYTVSWVTSTAANFPTWGAGSTNVCRYAIWGDMVMVNVFLAFTGATFGGGGAADNYRWGLPVSSSSVGNSLGMVNWFPNTGASIVMEARAATSTAFELWNPATRSVVDAATPAGWGVNSVISGVLLYERA